MNNMILLIDNKLNGDFFDSENFFFNDKINWSSLDVWKGLGLADNIDGYFLNDNLFLLDDKFSGNFIDYRHFCLYH